MKTIYASQTGARLDSDVIRGGGTDDTEYLQRALDEAKDGGSVHLIMDGAALVRGLDVYSNTTIECPTPACGFFLKEGSDRAVIWNKHWSLDERPDCNITLLGGTYNQNRMQQRRQTDAFPEREVLTTWDGAEYGKAYLTMGLQFVGVEHLTIRGIHIRDTQTYGLLVTNWKWCVIEDVHVAQPHLFHAQNQDGMHFLGPGQYLTIRNVGGQAGDDFIGIGADENDRTASITDVSIDGVFLDDADQGIRLLCAHEGWMDRIAIRNVFGTYRSFGFFLDPFFAGSEGGRYGSVTIENVDLRQTGVDYDYTSNFLFRVGGNWDRLTLRDVRANRPLDGRTLLQVGSFYPERVWPTRIGALTLENLTVTEGELIENIVELRDCEAGRILIRDAYVQRKRRGGALIRRHENVKVRELAVEGLTAENLEALARDDAEGQEPPAARDVRLD